MSTLATFIQHILGSPRHSNQRRKINKSNPIGKEVKLSLFADGTILYIENYQGSSVNSVKLQDIKLM